MLPPPLDSLWKRASLNIVTDLYFLLANGEDRVERIAVRRRELYERAMYMADGVDTMFKLGNLLHECTKGVVPNPVCRKGDREGWLRHCNNQARCKGRRGG